MLCSFSAKSPRRSQAQPCKAQLGVQWAWVGGRVSTEGTHGTPTGPLQPLLPTDCGVGVEDSTEAQLVHEDPCLNCC